MKGLENFLYELAAHAWTGVGKIDLPIFAHLFQRDSEDSPGRHGADCIFAEIPEYLFDLVSISHAEGVRNAVEALDTNASVLRDQPVLQQGKGVFEQRQEIYVGELILLASGIAQKVCDDAVQTLGLTHHNLQQLAMLVAKVGNTGQHAHGAGDRSQRITDLVRDRRRQPTHRRQAVLNT